jgi:two-component system, chemotaxis family, chemotaxis protein CheY
MKSLVADDVLVIRRLIQRALSVYGVCEESINGKETVSKFINGHKTNEPFDLICLDILMPKKDGLQVLKDIRQYESQNNIPESKHVKILMTTILHEPNVVEQAVENGCDGYMVKPIQLNKLLAQIRKFGLIE